MLEAELRVLVKSLCGLPNETERVEFKVNYAKPNEVGEYISALANSAVLHQKTEAYIVWGIENQTHRIIGTRFTPRSRKVNGQELENWLSTRLSPRIDFRFHEFRVDNQPVVLLSIPTPYTPVAFGHIRYIRIGSYKKKLEDHIEKERKIWDLLRHMSFEKDYAARGVGEDEVLSLIDYPSFFELLHQNLPSNKSGILKSLARENIIKETAGKYNITNLGAILFAKQLSDFDTIYRKAPRVVIYSGTNRTKTIKEQIGTKGYAVGFGGLIQYINEQLPTEERIAKGYREEVKTYPEIAVRELVANALIHQDLSSTGDGPMVEVFSDRLEVINPGVPLLETLLFTSGVPRSRNESLAGFMRRLNICEERGSGIIKVMKAVEEFTLPAPEFATIANSTKATLFAAIEVSKMRKNDKARACYQHACLLHLSGQTMTNRSLRLRLSITSRNYQDGHCDY